MLKGERERKGEWMKRGRGVRESEKGRERNREGGRRRGKRQAKRQPQEMQTCKQNRSDDLQEVVKVVGLRR